MVNTIIDQLFDDLFEKSFSENPSNKKMLNKLNNSIENLQKDFNDEQRSIFDTFLMNSFEYNQIETKNSLKTIFSKGVLLGMEISKYN